jgi:hypothetical protein
MNTSRECRGGACHGLLITVPTNSRDKDLDLQSFRSSITGSRPPDGLSIALQALWWDAKGDWQKAHECAQEREDQAGMRVHAYLHRKEGDQSNAAYWYRRCRVSPATGTLDKEWEDVALTLLAEK